MTRLLVLPQKAKKALAALPPKAPAKKPLDQALEELKPAIELLLARGYTRAEVVEHLAKQGIPAKLYHLKALLAAARAPRIEASGSAPAA
jgi:SOS response regulatory protein OraA/RecX